MFRDNDFIDWIQNTTRKKNTQKEESGDREGRTIEQLRSRE